MGMIRRGYYTVYWSENGNKNVENNNNVSVFPSNPDDDNSYPLSFDVMPPLWASYARVVDIRVDMIISDGWYDLFVHVGTLATLNPSWQLARSDKVPGCP